MEHLVVSIAVQVDAGEVVTDHRPLAEPICATVDDPKAADEEKAEGLLKLGGPSVLLGH